MARRGRPRLTAVTLRANSGREVPSATIFAPMRIEGTPRIVAISDAEETANRAARMTTAITKTVFAMTDFLSLALVDTLPLSAEAGLLPFVIL